MEVGQLIRIIREIDDPVAVSIIKSLTERLQHLVDIELDYLTLDRETDTLSGRRVAARENGKAPEWQSGGCHLHFR